MMRTDRPDGDRRAVIAGLGMSELGNVYGKSAARFAADAVAAACADAGIALSGLDGLITNAGLTADVGLGLAVSLGCRDLRLLTEVQAYGSSAGLMVQLAAMAVEAGHVQTVACVFADAPLREKRAGGAAYGAARQAQAGIGAIRTASRMAGANNSYALATRRHMLAYGTTSEQLGAVAVATRAWAAMNPLARMRTPITIEDHQNSRIIADPLRLLDCCLVSNGGICVIVTSAGRARAMAKPAVHVLGWGQCHPGYGMHSGSPFGLESGAKRSGEMAFAMAGLSVGDVDIAELYDCYTFTTLITLEDYGFCSKGEGGEFVASGALMPGGSCPVNTGGGQLSAYYMWGMTPLSEAIVQARGEAGQRQVDRHDVVLVSGNGGALDHHSTLVLSPHTS